VDDAAVGPDRVVNEVGGRIAGERLDGVADELHRVVGIVGAAVGHARDIADQRPKLGLADPERSGALGDGCFQPLVGQPQVVLLRRHRFQVTPPMVVRFTRQPVEARAHACRSHDQDRHCRSEAMAYADDADDRAPEHRCDDRQHPHRSDDIEGQITLPRP